MLGLLPTLILKTLLLASMLVVFMLAARRLLLSTTANAWLYTATALFAFLTLVGLMPWGMGIGRSHPVFFLFAAAAPVVWYGVVTMCNSTRQARYDSELERTVLRLARLLRRLQSAAPQVFSEGSRTEAPIPVFRHTPRPAPRPAPTPPRAQSARPLLLTDAVGEPKPNGRSRVSEATKSLLGIARGMRRNPSSEGRRPKLLPAPGRADERDIPFLQARESV